MGRSTFRIVLSLVGAGAAGFCIFVLLEAMLPARHPRNAGAVLFRFQLSSMIAMGVFAGLGILLYVRLSRSAAGDQPGRAKAGKGSLRKK